MKPILYIVIPCYNEEKVLPITSSIFLSKLESLINKNKISQESRIVFVNDGSSDATWSIIKELHKDNKYYNGISLSRNRGHQNALLAGLMAVKNICDITISIDCDGQDDINAMDEMIEDYISGNEIVYGVRKKRDTDTVFKRNSAIIFYKLMNLLGSETVSNHADYRLLSSKVLNELERFKEVNLFLRGLVPLVGFKSTVVYYNRKERIAGKSHYPLHKMISLAFNGITSLSVKPIRIITLFGLFLSFSSFIAIIWVIVTQLNGETITGWASMLSVVLFLGGIQLFSLGIIGEYVGKIYLESKERPRYIIEETTLINESDKL